MSCLDGVEAGACAAHQGHHGRVRCVTAGGRRCRLPPVGATVQGMDNRGTRGAESSAASGGGLLGCCGCGCGSSPCSLYANTN
jgi:hypothetical protein